MINEGENDTLWGDFNIQTQNEGLEFFASEDNGIQQSNNGGNADHDAMFPQAPEIHTLN